MATTAAPSTAQTPTAPTPRVIGSRVNGKTWHAPKTAFRPRSGLAQPSNAYAERMRRTKEVELVKQREKEMKEEKAAIRDERIRIIKDRREKKEERERHEMLKEKMGRKRAERMRRKEKRNKLLGK